MKSSTVCVDPRMPDDMREKLSLQGVRVLTVPRSKDLPEPTSGHPDMLGAVLPDGALLVTESYYADNTDFFAALDRPVCLTQETLSGCYPGDVLFDALIMGNTLYGKQGTVSNVLLSRYPRFVPVKQGYARCSVLPVSDFAAITSDMALAKALLRDGIDVLLIRPGFISLPGYNTGFIGGAGVQVSQNRLVFFGDPQTHPDGEAILRFIEDKKISAVSLGNGSLCDYGGMWVFQITNGRDPVRRRQVRQKLF